jgi:hypothetical protein
MLYVALRFAIAAKTIRIRFAIELISLGDGCEIAVQSICMTFVIDSQSIFGRNRAQSRFKLICISCEITAMLLRIRCACCRIASESVCNQFRITAESLRNHCAIVAQLLRYCCGIAVQSFAIATRLICERCEILTESLR